MSEHTDEDAMDCVNMVEVLEEEQKLEEDAKAVLGGSDDKHCTYPKGSLSRQALYSCVTCTKPETEPAGVCLACCLECHEGHDLYELYTKRNFTCDCGNNKFGDKKCKLWPEKSSTNESNQYNQNFQGLYCMCHRPYPDPEDDVEDAMIQCVLCEDWFHGRHLKVSAPEDNDYGELTCFQCVEKWPFLMYYKHLQVLCDQGQRVSLRSDSHQGDVDVDNNHQGETAANDSTTVTDTGSEPGQDESAVLKQEAGSACDQGKSESADFKKSEESETKDSSKEASVEVRTHVEDKSGSESKTSPGEETKAGDKSSPVEEMDKVTNSTNGPNTASGDVCRLSELDASAEFSNECHSIFWKEGWRKELCSCATCKNMYTEKNIPFITDVSDTITMYEQRGRHKDGPSSTRYERGLEALSQMNRVQQVEMLHGFNDLNTELKDYLKKFADNGKVVRAEDIKEFFSGLASRKKQKTDMSYFCK